MASDGARPNPQRSLNESSLDSAASRGPDNIAAPLKLQRFDALDFIRVMATISVVVLHAAAPVLYQYGTTPGSVWATHSAIDSAVRICVPLFFMVSGFLLLSSPTNTSEGMLREVVRRLLRIGLPLLAWSVFYQIGNAYANGQPVTATLVGEAVLQVFRGAAVYHLWFIYELGMLYILLPVLRAIAGSPRTGLYFTAVWLGLALISLMADLTGSAAWTRNFLMLGNSGYLVAGFLVRTVWSMPSLRLLLGAVCGYLACTLAIHLLTMHASEIANAFSERFFVYSTFLVMVQSLCAFMILFRIGQWICNSATFLMPGIRAFSRVSFGIYFVHVIFLERVGYNVLGVPSETPFGAIAAIASTVAYTVALSWLVAWLLGCFRPTRWLVA